MDIYKVKGDKLVNTLLKDFIGEKLIQKIIKLVELLELEKNKKKDFLDQKAFELSEELKATWWEKNKGWFLEGV